MEKTFVREKIPVSLRNLRV